MPAQLTYELRHAKGLHGQLADLDFAEIVSRSVENEAGIGFGVVVSRGTDGFKQAVPGVVAGHVLGVTLRSIDREGRQLQDNTTLYRDTETAAILRRGYMMVRIPSGGTAGAGLFAVNSTGVLDAGTADTGETQLDGYTLEEDVAAGEIGVIRLNGELN